MFTSISANYIIAKETIRLSLQKVELRTSAPPVDKYQENCTPDEQPNSLHHDEHRNRLWCDACE